MIPFPPFEPDKSPFNVASTDGVTNALPVADGWGPAKGFSPISTALSEQCYGAHSVETSDGSNATYAFTATTMNLYNPTTLGWTDVTPLAGATNLPSGDTWSSVQWGDDLIATNLTDGPLVIDAGSPAEFIALAGSPPNAKYVITSGEYVILMHTDVNAQRVHWSGISDAEHWTIDEKGCDLQDLPDGGPIMGGVGAEHGAYILQRDKIRRMIFNETGKYSFSFVVANPSRGCAAPASLVEAGGTFFYLDEDGFYQGPEGKPIGAEKINRYFLENVDMNYLYETQGSYDRTQKMVWWRFRKINSTHAMIGYDWQLDRWTTIEDDSTFLFNAYSPGFTLESLALIHTNLDDMTISLDSRAWQGGRPAMGGFDSLHRFGLYEGANLEATITTGEVQLGGPMNRAYVNGYRIETDSANFTSRVCGKDNHSDTTNSSTTDGPDPTGVVPVRFNSRLMQFEVTIPEGEVWSHVSNVAPFVRKAGRQ